MKKLFAMLMALTILMTMAACGQQTTDEAGGTVDPGAVADQSTSGQVDMPADDAIAALKAAATDAPQAKADDAPNPAKYQASRSAAADLAQPAPGASAKPKATINTGGIYAARRAGKEA